MQEHDMPFYQRWVELFSSTLFLLPVLMVPVLFSGDFNTNTLLIKEPVLHLCIIGLVIGFVLTLLFQRSSTYNKKIPVGITLLVTAYLGYLFYSKTMIGKHPNADYEFARWTAYFLLFLSTAYLSIEQSRLKKYVITTALVSFPVCLYGILQTQEWFKSIDRAYFVDWEAFAWEMSGVRRVTSSLCNPDYFAGYLIAVFPVTFIAAVTYKKWLRYGLFFLCALQVISLLFTYSRGGWLSFFVVSLLMSSLFIYVNWVRDPVLVPTRIRPFSILMMIVVFFMGGVALTVWKWDEVHAALYRIANFGSGDSVSSRPYFYEGAYKMWADAPLFGHGIGMYGTVFPQYRSVELTRIEPFQEKYVEQVHNEYLEIAANTGIIGILFYTVLLFLSATLIWKSLIYNRDRENLILLGLGCGIFAALFHNMFTVTLRFAPSAFLFWSFLGVCVGSSIRSLPISTKKLHYFTYLIAVGMLILVPFLYMKSTKHFIGDHLVRHAIDVQNELHPQMSVNKVRNTLEEALISLEKGTRFVPQALRGYFFQAKIFNSKIGDFPQANHMYEKIEALHPSFTSTRRNLCVNYLNQAKKLLEQNPNFSPLALECIIKAQYWAKKAVESDPLEPEHHYLYGRCLMEQGNLQLAKESLLKAIELIPFMPPNYSRVTVAECNTEIELINKTLHTIQY